MPDTPAGDALHASWDTQLTIVFFCHNRYLQILKHPIPEVAWVRHMQGTPVRIIAVSSSAHQMDGLDLEDLHFRHRKYGTWKAYGQSKLCNILFAKELARR
jgi:NAD(P)-dependent dehydrogenase (short-subunit alcohol dehydrogenase family)